ncbi:unnamed protein product [Amoebophrya sp. A25]|nr:unnamed protein product [Amoebophrya sp. A25]|eukprot:GSA25T00003953001.1
MKLKVGEGTSLPPTLPVERAPANDMASDLYVAVSVSWSFFLIKIGIIKNTNWSHDNVCVVIIFIASSSSWGTRTTLTFVCMDYLAST